MQLSRTRLVAGVAAAALPLAVLAGCGEDEPKPKFEEPTSASPSESSSPTEPVEPTPPAAMKGDDVAGARAFVKYYFDLLGYAQATGDTDAVSKVALPDCAACSGTVRFIRQIYKTGGEIEGGTFTVSGLKTSLQGEFSSDGKTYAATGNVATTSQVISGSAKPSFNSKTGPGSQDLQFLVTRSGTEWRMARWGAR
jgi:hypothetical protein